jgi:hypothetical protein
MTKARATFGGRRRFREANAKKGGSRAAGTPEAADGGEGAEPVK